MKTTDLYRFSYGDNNLWRYNNTNRLVAYNGEGYAPETISRGKIEQKSEIFKAVLDVNISIKSQLAKFVLSTYGERFLYLTLYSKKDNTIVVEWKGKLANFTPEIRNLKLEFNSNYTSMKSTGARARYQKTCRHSLYRDGCGLDMDNFAVVGPFTDVNDNVITIPAASTKQNNYFNGGIVKPSDGAFGLITNHFQDKITLVRAMSHVIADNIGENLTLYPGCDHIRTTCANKFNNLNNYGGFDWIPVKNPLDGSFSINE